MRIAFATAAVAGGLLSGGWIQPAVAVPLPASTTVALPGTTVALRPELAGVVFQTGEDSYFFFLDSHATAYARVGSYGLVGTGGNGISDQFQTFAPAAPVPEPAEWALILVGFGLIARLGKGKRGV